MGARSDLATSWEAVAALYRAGLEALSPGLSENHGPPVALAATNAEARVAEAFAWVRDRPTRLARPEAAWSAGRSLPGPLRSNDLTDTDRVHTLAWLLRAHGVPFRFAVARPAAAAPLDPAAPQPRAFQTALLAVRQGAGLSSGSAPGSSGLSSGSAPGSSGLSSGSAPGSSGDAERWQLLDPGCATCGHGEVRPALRGGAALLLLANQPAQLLSLSAGDPVSLPSHTPEATP
jgi:hypothetical protein